MDALLGELHHQQLVTQQLLEEERRQAKITRIRALAVRTHLQNLINQQAKQKGQPLPPHMLEELKKTGWFLESSSSSWSSSSSDRSSDDDSAVPHPQPHGATTGPQPPTPVITPIRKQGEGKGSGTPSPAKHQEGSGTRRSEGPRNTERPVALPLHSKPITPKRMPSPKDSDSTSSSEATRTASETPEVSGKDERLLSGEEHDTGSFQDPFTDQSGFGFAPPHDPNPLQAQPKKVAVEVPGLGLGLDSSWWGSLTAGLDVPLLGVAGKDRKAEVDLIIAHQREQLLQVSAIGLMEEERHQRTLLYSDWMVVSASHAAYWSFIIPSSGKRVRFEIGKLKDAEVGQRRRIVEEFESEWIHLRREFQDGIRFFLLLKSTASRKGAVPGAKGKGAEPTNRMQPPPAPFGLDRSTGGDSFQLSKDGSTGMEGKGFSSGSSSTLPSPGSTPPVVFMPPMTNATAKQRASSPSPLTSLLSTGLALGMPKHNYVVKLNAPQQQDAGAADRRAPPPRAAPVPPPNLAPGVPELLTTGLTEPGPQTASSPETNRNSIGAGARFMVSAEETESREDVIREERRARTILQAEYLAGSRAFRQLLGREGPSKQQVVNLNPSPIEKATKTLASPRQVEKVGAIAQSSPSPTERVLFPEGVVWDSVAPIPKSVRGSSPRERSQTTSSVYTASSYSSSLARPSMPNAGTGPMATKDIVLSIQARKTKMDLNRDAERSQRRAQLAAAQAILEAAKRK